MHLEVDQSGRVEETNRPTVVAVANHNLASVVVLSTKVKQRLYAAFIARGRRKMFGVKTFAALTYLAVKSLLAKQPEIVIDLEYPGFDDLVKDQLLTFARNEQRPLEHSSIAFAAIGKYSPAHHAAITVFRGRDRARRVTLEELKRLLSI